MVLYDAEAGDKFIVVDRMSGQIILDVAVADTVTGRYEVYAKDDVGNPIYQDYKRKRIKRKGRILVLRDERC